MITIVYPKIANTCLFQHFSSALTTFDGLSASSSLLLMVLTAALPKMLGVAPPLNPEGLPTGK
jgi:hypothetical protein